MPGRTPAHALTEGVRRGQPSAVELATLHLERIRDVDGILHAFLEVDGDSALRRAAEIDERLRKGDDPGPLAGLPVAVKDNILTLGRRTTCASRSLADFTPSYDATAVNRLEAAGAIVLGKTNLDEFGMGSSTETSAFGVTRNPWDPERVPGGSSGGSAAAVAAGSAAAALGSDTGGSIRQPAAFCGLVGLKPQYGRVSRHGLVAFASSLDQIGPLALCARDAGLLLNAIAGEDERDATTLRGRHPVDLDAIEPQGRHPLRGLRLAVPRSWWRDGLGAATALVLEETQDRFRCLGAEIVEVSLPEPRYAVAAYYILSGAEASSNLARYDGVRFGSRSPDSGDLASLYEISRGEGFGPEVKRRILTGTFVLSEGYADAYYHRAQEARGILGTAVAGILNEAAAILLPVSPTPPFLLGERLRDPLEMYLSDLFTVAANLVAHPAVSFPAGATEDGLPVGMQLIGRREDEAGLLRLVRAHETAHDGSGAALCAQRPLPPPATAAPVPRGGEGA